MAYLNGIYIEIINYFMCIHVTKNCYYCGTKNVVFNTSSVFSWVHKKSQESRFLDSMWGQVIISDPGTMGRNKVHHLQE